MKICLINNLYPPLTVGGAEKIVKLLADKLSEDFEVIVLTSTYDGNKEISTDHNLKVYRLNTGNLYHYLQASVMPIWRKLIWQFIDIFGCQACKKIKNVLKQEKPDVVITHNLKGFSYQTPKLISKLKLKHIHTLHDYQLIDPYGSLFRHGKNIEKLTWPLKIYVSICRRLFAKIDLVISPSKFVLDKHLEYGFFRNSKHVILKNPANISAREIKPQILTDKIRLLFIGQIEEHKGIKFLVDSFKDFKSEQFTLTIAGEGKLYEQLKNNNQDKRINYLGNVPHNQIADLFAQSNLTVVPSLWWDNSPTVIYESFANSVPVLVSDSGGSKELVEEGKTGFIFKSGDSASLISTLDKIAQNKANLAKFGASGREYIGHYTTQNYINRLIVLCQDLNK